MFANKFPFLITLLQYIRFGTAEVLADQKGDTILRGIQKVIHEYRQHGLCMTFMIMDSEFENRHAELSRIQWQAFGQHWMVHPHHQGMLLVHVQHITFHPYAIPSNDGNGILYSALTEQFPT